MLLRSLLIVFLVLPVQGHGVPPDGIEDLLVALDRIRQADGVAGLGLILVDSRQTLWSGGRGVADRETGQAMSADTLIRIGSISKAFTALSLLSLEGKSRLSLDTPIASLITTPPYDNPWAGTHPVTLAQLLEHTAGLTDMTRTEWDHNLPLSLADALQVDPGSRRLQWPAGLHSSYSNSGAGVAAYVMEQATGLDFEKYTDLAVFAPLGMDTATFERNEQVKIALATGYDSDGRTVIPYWHTLYRPFAGINVTVRQMGPFVQMLLARGRLGDQQVFSARQIERMENPRTNLAAHSGLAFGYGLGNYHRVHAGFVFHGHGGDADGYLNHFGYNREAGMGYFLVINAFKGATLRRLRNLIEDFIVTGIKPRFKTGVPQPGPHLEALTGHYRTVTHRFPGQAEQQLQISYDQGRLYLQRDDSRQHLIPLSRWHFRRSFEPVATTAFIQASDGQLFLQGPFGNYARFDPESADN